MRTVPWPLPGHFSRCAAAWCGGHFLPIGAPTRVPQTRHALRGAIPSSFLLLRRAGCLPLTQLYQGVWCYAKPLGVSGSVSAPSSTARQSPRTVSNGRGLLCCASSAAWCEPARTPGGSASVRQRAAGVSVPGGTGDHKVRRNASGSRSRSAGHSSDRTAAGLVVVGAASGRVRSDGRPPVATPRSPRPPTRCGRTRCSARPVPVLPLRGRRSVHRSRGAAPVSGVAPRCRGPARRAGLRTGRRSRCGRAALV